MPRFSAHFGLSHAQPELDFVDIFLDGDLPVYVDPFAISLYDDDLSRQCNDAVVAFFQTAINAVRADDTSRAEMMLQRLSEPKSSAIGQRSRGVPEEDDCTGYAAELVMLVSVPISLASEVNLTDDQVAFSW